MNVRDDDRFLGNLGLGHCGVIPLGNRSNRGSNSLSVRHIVQFKSCVPNNYALFAPSCRRPSCTICWMFATPFRENFEKFYLLFSCFGHSAILTQILGNGRGEGCDDGHTWLTSVISTNLRSKLDIVIWHSLDIRWSRRRFFLMTECTCELLKVFPFAGVYPLSLNQSAIFLNVQPLSRKSEIVS